MQQNKITKAKDLRRNSTESENRVWSFLRDRKTSGFKFRRQQPIDHYIVDFICFEKRLIIELDGGQHNLDKDAPRTAYLEQQGFRILRFWNNDVMTDQEGVFSVIQHALMETPPHPDLLPQGEKEAS